MLRNLIIAILLAGAALSMYLGDSRLTGGLILAALLNTYFTRNKIKGNVTLQWELDRLAVLLARTVIVVSVTIMLAAALSTVGRRDAVMAGALAAAALTSAGLMPVLHFIAHRKRGGRGLHNLVKVIRCALTATAAKLSAVWLSLGFMLLLRTAPAITGLQLLAVEAALVLPLAALGQDKIRHKLKRETSTSLRHKLTALTAISSFLGFGLLAAALAYGNYLLFFARHSLSPAYLDPALPLHQQATTLTCVTLILCLYVCILFERADTHEKFFTNYLRSNKKLLLAFAISLCLIGVVAYIPWLQTLFATGSLSLIDWVTAVLAAALYAGLRLVQRHTRQHTRHAVLRLHREIHAPN